MARFRTYHELDSPITDLERQIGAQQMRVDARLASIDRVVGVTSGKGGVGKSFVTALLATALARDGAQVGVLDADFNGPTAGRLLGAARESLGVGEDGVDPATGSAGVRVMSMGLLLEDDTGLRWRGPEGAEFTWKAIRERSTLREFIADVRWGALDWLLVDLPPGPGRPGELFGLVPDMTGLIAVTIPTDAACDSVGRALGLARSQDIPLLGLVENQAGYRCPTCDSIGPLYPGAAGPLLAERFRLPILARLPFDARAARLIEDGAPDQVLEQTALGPAIRELAREISGSGTGTVVTP